MSRGPDAGTALCRAIEHSARGAGCSVTISSSEATRWASATFTGMRHRLMLDGPPTSRVEIWLGMLPEADLPIRGHIVADLAIASRRTAGAHISVTLEALTVEN